MKYIEFLGLPGSGKTTLAEEMVAILRARQRTVFPKLEARQAILQNIMRQKSGLVWKGLEVGAHVFGKLLWRLLWEKHQATFLINFLYAYPGLIGTIVEAASRLEPPAEVPRTLFSANHLVHWVLDPAMLYQAAHEFLGPDDILIQEEGFCQQAYYLLAAFRSTALETNTLERYLRQIPRPHLLIMLASDPEQCEARMQERPKGVSSDVLRYLAVADRLDVLYERLNLYQQIVAYFEQQHVQVVRLDNQQLSTSRRDLENALARMT